ncbi:hypothetical protein AAZX31_14G064400 [Glycine max]
MPVTVTGRVCGPQVPAPFPLFKSFSPNAISVDPAFHFPYKTHNRSFVRSFPTCFSFFFSLFANLKESSVFIQIKVFSFFISGFRFGMAGICCGVVGEAAETSSPIEPTSRPSARRSLDLLPLKYIAADVSVPPLENSRKRQRLDRRASPARECDNAVHSSKSKVVEVVPNYSSKSPTLDSTSPTVVEEYPRYGVTSVCGRRRDMEDAVSVHPSFCQETLSHDKKLGFHFFAVFDGHGCSHVATMCKERLHEIVKEEVHQAKENLEWESTMKKCFARMDEEVLRWSQNNETPSCRCELQTPHCDAVGSTAVVAVVTPEKIIVANCGDSRAVLCRNNVAVPLSDDHKVNNQPILIMKSFLYHVFIGLGSELIWLARSPHARVIWVDCRGSTVV